MGWARPEARCRGFDVALPLATRQRFGRQVGGTAGIGRGGQLRGTNRSIASALVMRLPRTTVSNRTPRTPCWAHLQRVATQIGLPARRLRKHGSLVAAVREKSSSERMSIGISEPRNYWVSVPTIASIADYFFGEN